MHGLILPNMPAEQPHCIPPHPRLLFRHYDPAHCCCIHVFNKNSIWIGAYFISAAPFLVLLTNPQLRVSQWDENQNVQRFQLVNM